MPTQKHQTMWGKQFGGKVTSKYKKIYQESDNWKGGKFQNLVDTQTGVDWKKIPSVICKQVKGHEDGNPKAELPILPFDRESFMAPSDEPKYVWLGHSVVMINFEGKIILIDPMLGPDASPIAPTKTKRFSSGTLDLIDDLPEIDLMLITHDHYDHLDLDSIQKLKSKTKQYGVALGVKRHLVSWGVEEDKIQAFDWWDTMKIGSIEITYTPTRHFSGRGLSSLAKCLWGGWAMISKDHRVWFSGDGGFANHFEKVAEHFGSFDIAFMECGQYCTDWADIHMFPEESVKAATIAGAKHVVPLHWAGFNLSYFHAWYDPVEDFLKHAKNTDLKVLTPAMGEIFTKESDTSFWWEEHK